MRLIRPVLLDNHGIGWENYVASYPTGATPELFLANDLIPEALHHTSLDDFFTAAAKSPRRRLPVHEAEPRQPRGLRPHVGLLAFVERKWNLPALTHRDANANDLTDFLDLGALAGRPAHLPTAAEAGRPRRLIGPARLLSQRAWHDPAAGVD